MNTIALRAFIGFSGGELAPKLVITLTGDRVLARVTGALAMSAVGSWLAWASRIGPWVVALIASLGATAAWLALTAGRPHWQAAMLATRATIAVTALWLAAHVERPRMAIVVALGMILMIGEVAVSYAVAPGGPGQSLTTIAAAYGPYASSVVPAILLLACGWAYLGRPDRR